MSFVPTSSAPSISVGQHVERILRSLAPLPAGEQPLLESLGLPLCEHLYSAVNVPGFDNSAMDGYAVNAADLESASAHSPVLLPVAGEVAAGQSKLFAMPEGTAVKIMTGAPVPHGADSVVPVEGTDAGSATVRITQSVAVGQHIRRVGEDICVGDLLAKAGSIVGPRQVALLASVGLAQIPTRPRPRVVILSTGAELRDPGTKLSHDAIYDSNSFMLAAAVRSAGALAYRVGIVGDDPHEFRAALSDQLVRADLVITSGGVSKGEYDVVKEVLSGLGTVWFGEVRMQPGKPQGYGRVGEDGIPLFALPGNPVSSYVSFELFVLPALRRMMGLEPYYRPRVKATLAVAVRSMPNREQYLRARYELGDQGAEVVPVGGAGSHLLGGLSEANALLVVPEEATGLEAGADVDVLLLDRPF